ncbi:MAG: transporter substrate-binding domain-containing protein [SAR202 cluster bacterium]|nr:transporter substrate-binding domain-containing protein [SAR202 cluster bacterium]
MDREIQKELSSNGTLRAAINMSNFLLVTDKTKDGIPIGVSPDMAQELANKLDLQLKLIPYDSPGEIADDAENDKWDICNIGAEPQRAEKINFSAAYAEIQATYIVQYNSKINNILDVDKIGNKICVASRTAYGLWLERNIHNAELIQVEAVDSPFDVFLNENLDALAGLRPALINDVKKISGAKILEGQFMSVQQAIGTSIQNIHSAIYIAEFVEEMKKSSFVQKLIDKHNVNGRLSVAKLA